MPAETPVEIEIALALVVPSLIIFSFYHSRKVLGSLIHPFSWFSLAYLGFLEGFLVVRWILPREVLSVFIKIEVLSFPIEVYLVYILGWAGFWAGIALDLRLSRWIPTLRKRIRTNQRALRLRGALVAQHHRLKPKLTWISHIGGLVGALTGRMKLPHVFFLAWAIGVMGAVGQLIILRDIPFTNGDLYPQMDSKLVFLAETLAISYPYFVGMVLRKESPTRSDWGLLTAMGAVTLIAQTALGARNIPAKTILVLAFLAPYVGFHHKAVRTLYFILIPASVVAIIFIGGAFLKQQIYGERENLITTGIALIASNLVGNMYSLSIIMEKAGPTGEFHGQLIADSFLTYLPGSDVLYANAQIGAYVGAYPAEGLTYQSIASTIIGPAFADFGILGVLGQMMFMGMLASYCFRHFRINKSNALPLSMLLMILVLGLHTGLYYRTAFLVVGAIFLLPPILERDDSSWRWRQSFARQRKHPRDGPTAMNQAVGRVG